MTSDRHPFFSAAVVFVLILAGLGYYHFRHEQNTINREIDTALLRAAESAYLLVGDRFHEKVFRTPPAPIENAITAGALTALARTQNVERIYSLMADERGNLFYTSLSTDDHAIVVSESPKPFGSRYAPNPNVIQALATKQTVWEERRENETRRTFRSIYLPHATPAGERYVIGADVDTGFMRSHSYIAAFTATATSLLPLLGIFPLWLIYRRHLRNLADQPRPDLSETAQMPRQSVSIPENGSNRSDDPIDKTIDEKTDDSGGSERMTLLHDLKRHPLCALMILRLSNFREICDFFGPAAGGRLMEHLGQWLRNGGHSPYRLSDGEFALVIEGDLPIEELARLAEELISCIRKHPFSIGVENISPKVTIGIDPGPGISLANADIALQRAQTSTRAFAFYDHERRVEEEYKTNIAITKMIHEAVKAGRIVCHYQPVVSTASQQIEYYETLVRMTDELGHLFLPEDFLPIAQKTLLYPHIARHVIRQSCEAFRNRIESFSINLSIRDLLDPSAVAYIEKTILGTGTAERIIIEIPEAEQTGEFDAVASFVRKMKKLGARVAIDRFGTGCSSIEHLLGLDIDYLKLDPSLTRQIHTDPKQSLLVESLAAFLARMGVRSVAGSVESQITFERLSSAGINFVQGYYTGEPAPLPA